MLSAQALSPTWTVYEAVEEHRQLRASTVQPGLKGPSSELGLRCQVGKARGQLGGASDCDNNAPCQILPLLAVKWSENHHPELLKINAVPLLGNLLPGLA